MFQNTKAKDEKKHKNYSHCLIYSGTAKSCNELSEKHMLGKMKHNATTINITRRKLISFVVTDFSKIQNSLLKIVYGDKF